jgi:hypothetical protein
MDVFLVPVAGIKVVVNRSIYLDREDAKSVEEEERNLFLKETLSKIGVPLEEVWPDILLTVEQKIKLRILLGKLDIEIVEDGDRGYEIYHQNNLLSKWNKPKFLLRKDNKAKSLNKRLFFEMIINTWSVFEGDENG